MFLGKNPSSTGFLRFLFSFQTQQFLGVEVQLGPSRFVRLSCGLMGPLDRPAGLWILCICDEVAIRLRCYVYFQSPLWLTSASQPASRSQSIQPSNQKVPTNLERYVQLKGRHPMDLEVPVHVEGVGHQNPATNNQNPACRVLSM